LSSNIKFLFSYFGTGYLARHFLISTFYFSLYLNVTNNWQLRLMAVSGLLLYPFARFVYDSFINTLLTDTIIISNPILFLTWSFIRNLFLFSFAIFLAPLAFLLVAANSMTRKNQDGL
jgi:hypothetical protein